MKLLVVNYEYPPIGGGAASASWYVAKALRDLGHDITVLTSAFGSLSGTAVEDGIEVVRVPALRRSAERSGIVQMACFLVSALVRAVPLDRRRAFDASIAFFTIPSGPVAAWLAMRLDIPYIVSLRGGDVPGHVPGLERMHRLTTWLRRGVLKRAVAIIANSDSLAARSRAADPFPVMTVPNGVDTGFFSPGPHRADPAGAPSPYAFLFVGRLHAEKNVDLLISQLAKLRSQSKAAFRLRIVGDGAARSALETLARSLGADAWIEWLGWVDRRRLLEIYRDADCFVNPSQYEGMPNAVLEAMACGLPVIASDVGGNNEVVVQHQTGLLFSLGKADGLLEAAADALANRNAWLAMGAQARKAAVERYSWTSTASSYVRALCRTH